MDREQLQAVADRLATEVVDAQLRPNALTCLVADDVDRIWDELVKQTATVNWHVRLARREVAEVAATMDEPAQCAALLSAEGTVQ